MNPIRMILMGKVKCKRCRDRGVISDLWPRNVTDSESGLPMTTYEDRIIPCPACHKQSDVQPEPCPKCGGAHPWKQGYWFNEQVVYCVHCKYIAGD